MLRSTQDLWLYGVPTILLRSLKLIGKASRSALATCKTGLLANIGRGWCRPTCLHNGLAWEGWPGHDTYRVPGLDANWVGAHSILWSYYEHLPEMGGGLVTGGRMDYTYYISAPQRRVAKARTSEGSYLGASLFWTGILPCLPSQGRPLSWFSLAMACSKRSGLSMASVDRWYFMATVAPKFGWIPMATAMVGSASSPPLWAGNDWRPILGTSVDTRILPPPLSDKESLLLLSQWIRLPRDDLHIRHATNSWLQPGKVNIALGPDCDDSPHPIRELPLDLGTAPYLAMLFGPQKADQGHPNKTVKQEGSQAPCVNQAQNNELPSPEEVLVTLRVQVDSCRPADLSALITILLGGTPAICSNRALWIQAVQDHFDDVPLFVSCRKLLQLVCETAPHVGYDVYLVNSDGSHSSRDLVALCRGSAPFPSSGVHVFIRAKNALVSSSTSDDPQLANIDCTGLGGHDLGGFKDYDICIRTDKHGQSIYGPSVTPLESPGRDGVHHVSLVALGGSKAMHEVLVLHYMPTDSAEEWDTFLDLCLPQCTWVYVLARGERLPCTCITSAMWPPLIEDSPILLGLRHEDDAWPASWCPSKQVPAITPSITYLLKSMSVASQLALTAAFVFFTSCGTCLMSKWGVYWVALLFLRYYYMGSSPTTVPGSWWSTSLQTDCVNGILMMTHCAPFRANIALWIVAE